MESMILPVLMSNLKNDTEKQTLVLKILKKSSKHWIHFDSDSVLTTLLREIIWASEQIQSSKIALKKDQFLPARICLEKGQIFAILGKFTNAWILKLSKIALKKDQFLPVRICLEKGQIFAQTNHRQGPQSSTNQTEDEKFSVVVYIMD